MTICELAWRSALARRRLFAWNVAVPLLLLAPVALSPAAAPHRPAVFGVFYALFATFGAAIPTVRDAEEGWLDTLFATGVSRRRWMVETGVAGAALDLLQLGPATLVLVAASGPASPATLVALAAALALALAFANAVGLLLAAAVRSLAEAALACAATALLLLHLAGFFRTPASGWSRVAALFDPFRPLLEALRTISNASATAEAGGWAPALACAIAVLALSIFLAPRWTRRFEWPPIR